MGWESLHPYLPGWNATEELVGPLNPISAKEPKIKFWDLLLFYHSSVPTFFYTLSFLDQYTIKFYSTIIEIPRFHEIMLSSESTLSHTGRIALT